MAKHVDYPHEPGRLYDCPACEARCHCTAAVTRGEETECIFEGEHVSVIAWADGFGVWRVRVSGAAHAVPHAQDTLRQELGWRHSDVAESVWADPIREPDMDTETSTVYREGDAA